MKKANKIFSLVLAIVFVFAMAIPAFAAETWTGSITINGTEIVPVDGKTFKAYQILTAEAVDAENLDAGVIYSIPKNMEEFFAAYGKDVDSVVDAISAMDADDLQNFAVAALAAAKAANIAPETAENDTEANNAVFSDLKFGYYLIEDEGTATPISALMLRTTSAEVTIKADKPAIEKKIDGANDNDKSTTGLVDYNTATVGEDVPYVLISKVPQMLGYTSYTYVITDTFSLGLDFNNDVAVTVDGETYEDFTVAEVGQIVTITFNNFIDLEDKAGKEIKITYSAKVTEDAIIGVEGNPNTVKLTYSNNPQDNKSTEDTLEDVVYTYLVNLIINKTDANKNPLAGADFAIKQDDLTIATGTSDAKGIVTFTWTNGVGLKDGETYTIVETMAPSGYNEADEITFTVTCTDPITGTNCTWSSSNEIVTFTITEDTADDYFEATIINTTGGLLPETGGIGTTIFYIVGALLVVGAVILLVTKKRMSAEV